MNDTDAKDVGENRTELDRQVQVHAAALASIDAEAVKKEARGYSVMLGVFGYGKVVRGDGKLAKISHLAKLFCISFALLVPSLLIWRVVL